MSIGKNARLIAFLLYLGLIQIVYAQSGTQTVIVKNEPLPTGYIRFNIPAQSLTSALETYSILTRREILYDAKLVINRRSTAVVGVYTPQTALRMMLEGSGLAPGDMANNALMLEQVLAPLPRQLESNTAPPATVVQYYGRIQSRLKAAFCRDRGIQPGAYHVAVSFWIGADGLVSEVELLGSTGEAARDLMIDHTLRTLVIGSPPPGFAQPVTLVVSQWSSGMTRDCQSKPDESRPSGTMQ
ncbi:MAG: STN domain-containing protein [Pseudomonadota bacterium]